MKFAAAIMAALAFAAPAAVSAESVDCPEIPPAGEFFEAGTICRSLPGVLDTLGWPRDVAEVTSNELSIPAVEGATDAELTFEFIHDDGDFNFCFGFCKEELLNSTLVDAVRNDDGSATVEERLAFAQNCILENGVKVFDDLEHDAGHSEMITGVAVPSNIIFFLLPNNNAADFAADPVAFFAEQRHPLFSMSGANPEGLDQLVLFTNSDMTETAFAWEDKTRQTLGGETPVDSDEDFGDLVFTVNTLINAAVPTGCPADCDSTVADYVEGGSATATSEGTCACLSFDC